MFLVAFALCSLLSYGGRACVLTGQPEDVVAEVGTNATLTCPTDVDECTIKQCTFTWQRLMNGKYETISSCTIVYDTFKGNFSISGGPNWSLTIRGVEVDDARNYRCKIRRSNTTLKSITSEAATLIISSIISIMVEANSSQMTPGDSVVFSCLAQGTKGAHLTYNWLLDGTDINLFSTLDFDFSEDKQTLELKRLQKEQNGTRITCAAYSGSTPVKTSENFIIQIYDRPWTESTPIPTQPIVPDISTINPDLIRTNRDFVIPGGDGNTALFAGGGVAAVFFILLIVCLIYCLVFRGRNKTRPQRPNPRGDERRDAGAAELSETQLTKHAASESAKESTSCAREERAVEPHPLDSQTQVTAHRNQNNEDKPIISSAEKPSRLDPVYALVDKSHSQHGKSTGFPKDESQGSVVTAKDSGRGEFQSVQREPIPAVKVAPVEGSKPGRAPSGKKPPRVTPYHLSESRTHTRTEAKSEPPEQTAGRGGDGAAKDDPRLRNVEGLIYADLDLSRGSPRIVSSEEETFYAGIVNK